MKTRYLSILLISVLAFIMPSCHIIDALDGDKDKDDDKDKTDFSSITLSANGAINGSYLFLEASLKGNISKDFPETVEVTLYNPGPYVLTASGHKAGYDTDPYWCYTVFYCDNNVYNLTSNSSYTVKAKIAGKTITCSGTFNGRSVESTF